MEELTPAAHESMADLGEKMLSQAQTAAALPARRCERCIYYKPDKQIRPSQASPEVVNLGICYGSPPQTPGTHHATGTMWFRPEVAALDRPCHLYATEIPLEVDMKINVGAAAKPARQ